MSLKRFVIGTAVGGCAVFVTGSLLFALAPFSEFYSYAMNSGPATGVSRESPLVWAVFLGALSYSALVTLAIGSRPQSTGVAAGIKIGAVVGFLIWFTADFMLFGISNVGTLTSTIVDPLLEMVPGAVAGGIIAAVLGRVTIGQASTPPHASRA
jgi:hypothetical protein